MRSVRQVGTAIAAGQCLESGRLVVTESVVSVYQLDQKVTQVNGIVVGAPVGVKLEYPQQ